MKLVSVPPERLGEDMKKPKYCKRCGSALIEHKKQDGFDIETGKPLYETKLKCPNYGGWLGVLVASYSFNPHSYYTASPGSNYFSPENYDTFGI